jgi:hypothetical protein
MHRAFVAQDDNSREISPCDTLPSITPTRCHPEEVQPSQMRRPANEGSVYCGTFNGKGLIAYIAAREGTRFFRVLCERVGGKMSHTTRRSFIRTYKTSIENGEAHEFPLRIAVLLRRASCFVDTLCGPIRACTSYPPVRCGGVGLYIFQNSSAGSPPSSRTTTRI